MEINKCGKCPVRGVWGMVKEVFHLPFRDLQGAQSREHMQKLLLAEYKRSIKIYVLFFIYIIYSSLYWEYKKFMIM